MNPADNLRLSKSIKLLLCIGTPIGAILLALVIDLVQDSNIFLELKESKPIDAIINMGISINTGSVLIALVILSLLFNIFLFKRMNLYFKACQELGKLFYKTTLKLSKISKQPVKVQFNSKELTVDYESFKNDKRL